MKIPPLPISLIKKCNFKSIAEELVSVQPMTEIPKNWMSYRISENVIEFVCLKLYKSFNDEIIEGLTEK
jgi:hypothetical protein